MRNWADVNSPRCPFPCKNILGQFQVATFIDNVKIHNIKWDPRSAVEDIFDCLQENTVASVAWTAASMNGEPLENMVPATELVEDYVGRSEEKKKKAEAGNISQAPLAPEPVAPSNILYTKENVCSDPPQVNPEETKAAGVEPPVDWFEPLENDEDDVYSPGGNDPEEESVAGESEKSESIVGSEKTSKKSIR